MRSNLQAQFPLTIDKQYSMYGHIKTLAEAEKKGIEDAGGKADIYQYDSQPSTASAP